MIQNKVLKNTAKVLQFQVQIAQGGNVTAEQLAEEQKKLDKNVALDKAEAGKPATDVPFEATTADPEGNNQEKPSEADLKKFNDNVNNSKKAAGVPRV